MDSDTFTKLKDSVAICSLRGYYKQLDLYEWHTGLYAKTGAGYIRLCAEGNTTGAVRWQEIVLDKSYKYVVGNLGRLMVGHV